MPVFVCGPERLGGSSPSHRENCRADAPRFSARAPSPRLRAQSLDHKWQRHLVPAHLSHGDLDDVGGHLAIEDSREGIAHIEHLHWQTAVRLVGAGAAFADRHAHARDQRERAGEPCAFDLLATSEVPRIVGAPGGVPPDIADALVAQLDRALASEAKGCGFDPRRVQFAGKLRFEALREFRGAVGTIESSKLRQ